MAKTITTVYIENEFKEIIKDSKLNLSDWINEQLRKEFNGIEPISKEIEKHLSSVEILKEKIKDFKNQARKRIKLCSEAEITLLKELSISRTKGYIPHALYQRYLTETKKYIPYGEFIEILSELE